jgi:serralysin
LGAEGDWIDLSAIDANTAISGNQAFDFIGSDAFTAAGQLRLSNGILYADTNGDKAADLVWSSAPRF